MDRKTKAELYFLIYLLLVVGTLVVNKLGFNALLHRPLVNIGAAMMFILGGLAGASAWLRDRTVRKNMTALLVLSGSAIFYGLMQFLGYLMENNGSVFYLISLFFYPAIFYGVVEYLRDNNVRVFKQLWFEAGVAMLVMLLILWYVAMNALGLSGADFSWYIPAFVVADAILGAMVYVLVRLNVADMGWEGVLAIFAPLLLVVCDVINFYNFRVVNFWGGNYSSFFLMTSGFLFGLFILSVAGRDE